MSLLHSSFFLERILRHLACRIEGEHRRFALSFDDGPSIRNTPRLLDVLDRQGVRATFFLLGTHVRQHPHLVRRMVEEEHEIGLHGYGHWPPALVPPGFLASELQKTRTLIFETAGTNARLYRPPFGWITPGQSRFLQTLGYIPVLGDVYPGDHARPGAERIVERSIARLRGGSILILHDASAVGDYDRSHTIEAVPIIVRAMASRGLTAVRVGALLARSEG